MFWTNRQVSYPERPSASADQKSDKSLKAPLNVDPENRYRSYQQHRPQQPWTIQKFRRNSCRLMSSPCAQRKNRAAQISISRLKGAPHKRHRHKPPTYSQLFPQSAWKTLFLIDPRLSPPSRQSKGATPAPDLA